MITVQVDNCDFFSLFEYTCFKPWFPTGHLSCIWTSDCADFIWYTCLCVDEDPLAEDPFGSDLMC